MTDKLKLNLFDENFRHIKYSVPNRESENIEWVRDQGEWEGTTIFTDEHIYKTAPYIRSDKKIGWLLEPREYKPQGYDNFKYVLNNIDFCFTYDRQLLEQFPEKTKFIPFGGLWIKDENIKLHPKTKNISMIYSHKNFMSGHKLRHQIAEKYKDQIDLYGNGSKRPINTKEDGLVDYKYSVIIENSRTDNFFTEKLLDCLAVGTIPIYWGCPNIRNFFEGEAMLEFETLEDFENILETIKHIDYDNDDLSHFRNCNMLDVSRYKLPEDWLYNNNYL